MHILKSGVGNQIKVNDKRYLYFAGNNYLGLANQATLKKDVISCIRKYGLSFSASRGTTGTCELHLELERLLSEFKNKEDSVTFASGYMGNKILLHALQDKFSAIFIDSSAHPSILDGIPSTICKSFFYDHCNEQHLEDLLKTNRQYKPLIITDGVFALTGEIAPLDKIYLIAQKYNAILVVDDAHATGILGENGRGTPQHFQLDDSANIFQTETMSKSLGAYGGFISGSANIINQIKKKSSIYLGSTALPPPIVAAGIASIKQLKLHPELRVKVLENAQYVRNKIRNMSFATTIDNTPIIPVFFNSQENANSLSQYLYENYIIAPCVEYPVKMNKYLVRITVSAIHTKDQINNLVRSLNKWRDNHGID
ncbi:pyridoxal phosphate-dependent aminotransferase family protein [bacterium]|nr:pyridoxal phosphate-dependent aminotransferase family protein [bacterium]